MGKTILCSQQPSAIPYEFDSQIEAIFLRINRVRTDTRGSMLREQVSVESAVSQRHQVSLFYWPRFCKGMVITVPMTLTCATQHGLLTIRDSHISPGRPQTAADRWANGRLVTRLLTWFDFLFLTEILEWSRR
ncbi:hypothetical protein RRG08_057448 [Elysia crispata]|uniref:Uncharacterized protein n=1 Tax=Elysia crispata TaxID=231223 RepID=A0AAE1DA04_9GAST|nr:hypothetical protein RRG08_057448 [Elysia crispata]